MTTYVYETIPQSAGEVPVRFEFKQGMNDPKLTEQLALVNRCADCSLADSPCCEVIRRQRHR